MKLACKLVNDRFLVLTGLYLTLYPLGCVCFRTIHGILDIFICVTCFILKASISVQTLVMLTTTVAVKGVPCSTKQLTARHNKCANSDALS